MSESTQHTGDGEPNPQGSGTDPSGGGDTQADQLARTEERRRALQSELDRERARAAKLEAQLAEKDGTPPPAPAQPVDVNQAIRAALSRDRAMNAALASAREQFPLAGDLNPDAFDTPEALLDAASSRHTANGALRETLKADAEKEVREAYKAKFGVDLPTSPAGDSTTTNTGKLTVEQLAKMPMAEFVKLDPELVKRIRRGEE